MTANDIDYTQVSEGHQFTLESVQMLVDADRYVPLLLKMDGTVSDGSESRPMTIEREDSDYRSVPGCGEMYEPFATVMRIGGAMTPEQQAELSKAQVELDELEAQMASMPAAQRQMMESMMGPQLEMIKNMASGGGIQIESKVVELRCNTGLPTPMEMAQTAFGGATTGARTTTTADNLVQRIQVDLDKLGYNPGNTHGELDKPTVVAISRFQADRGMEVTGQATPQLAGILSAAVDAQN